MVVSSAKSTTISTSQGRVSASSSRSSTGTMSIPSLYAGMTTLTRGVPTASPSVIRLPSADHLGPRSGDERSLRLSRRGILTEHVPDVGDRLVSTDAAVLRVRGGNDQHVCLVEHLLERDERRIHG